MDITHINKNLGIFFIISSVMKLRICWRCKMAILPEPPFQNGLYLLWCRLSLALFPALTQDAKVEVLITVKASLSFLQIHELHCPDRIPFGKLTACVIESPLSLSWLWNRSLQRLHFYVMGKDPYSGPLLCEPLPVWQRKRRPKIGHKCVLPKKKKKLENAKKETANLNY